MMKNRNLKGLIVSVWGLLVILVPTVIFPPCSHMLELVDGGTVPMKCFWSGRAEIGIGFLILCGGLLLFFAKSAETRKFISVSTLLTSLVGIAVPAFLIGGCAMETMTCRTTTFPALYVLHALLILFCVVSFFSAGEVGSGTTKASL